MSIPRTPALLCAGALALTPLAARASSLTVDDALYSQADCLDAGDQELTFSWDLSDASGSSIEILGSDTSGCTEDDDEVTTLLVDGISTSQTSYPASGDSALTLNDLLDAAGASASCEGTDYRVYLCVRLLDSSGSEVATATASVKLQLQHPPPPEDVTVQPGEHALHVSWSAGTAVSGARASSESYQVTCTAGDQVVTSAETTATSIRVGGLQNGTTYDVLVYALSEAGNYSDPLRAERRHPAAGERLLGDLPVRGRPRAGRLQLGRRRRRACGARGRGARGAPVAAREAGVSGATTAGAGRARRTSGALRLRRSFAAATLRANGLSTIGPADARTDGPSSTARANARTDGHLGPVRAERSEPVGLAESKPRLGTASWRLNVAVTCCSLALLLAAPAARADDLGWPELGRPGSSSDNGSGDSKGTFGLWMQSYRPGIDEEFGGDGAYGAIFGDSRGWMFRGAAARTVFDRWGAVDVGLGAGWFQTTGHGLTQDASTGEWVESADQTRLRVVPLTAFLAYRLDVVHRRAGWPFEPYARVALERYLWWTDAEGGSSHSGATDGWSFTLGTAILLDGLDRDGQRALAREVGLQHTALTIEVGRAFVNDFGSSRSWTLSDPGWSVGIGLQLGF
ncbi:MAG: fibronectin type III domain-containing protein [Anaeromyxobacter sp.]